VEVAGRKVHLLSTGDGPPVLLLHGNGGLGEEILAPFASRHDVTWLAPDRPGYGFSAAADGPQDPAGQALWAVRLLDALRVPAVHVVAHSIAAGMALCLADRDPDRILSMTLLNPFCRPTPHSWKPVHRLAVAPVVGALVRPAVPYLLSIMRERFLARLAAPNRPPATLRRLPFRHLARPSALLTLAGELDAFNEGMKRADPRVPPSVPVVAVVGSDDRTADPDWHVPWLRDRVATLDLRTQQGVGHMLHHVCPDVAWTAVRDAMDAGRSASRSVAGTCAPPASASSRSASSGR
jgi:pimeloyl-ACP methyl ester carboxylesterase